MDDANERPRERSERSERRPGPDRGSGDRGTGARGGPGGDRPAPRSRFGAREEGGGSPGGGRPRSGGRFGGRRRREPVFFDNEVVDYKDVARLRRCIDERGKIVGRRKTGNSAKVQRKVTIAIKRARHMALLPFEVRDARR